MAESAPIALFAKSTAFVLQSIQDSILSLLELNLAGSFADREKLLDFIILTTAIWIIWEAFLCFPQSTPSTGLS